MKTVKLFIEKLQGVQGKEKSHDPVVILHGLFGSGRNWRTIGKRLNAELGRDVLLVDLRNHGRSPHAASNTYADMVSDLEHTLDEFGVPRAVLMGHSMGGKASMKFAQRHPSRVSRLVVVDVAPVEYAPAEDFYGYVRAMRELPLERVGSLQDAEEHLKPRVQDPGVRQFLLTNLLKDGAEGRRWRWAPNLDVLADHLDAVRGHDAEDRRRERAFEGPTTFIRGGKSQYVLPHMEPTIEKLFPNSTIETVPGAGHWVHAEKPKDFLEILQKKVFI